MQTGRVEAMGQGRPQARSERLFIALWPDAQTAAALQAWAQAAHAVMGGRIMAREDLHLTLAFLGHASVAQAQTLAQACAGWPVTVRPLTLARVGVFERARVAWAGPAPQAEIGWLHALVDALWQNLGAQGWVRGAEAFRPHVSLLRRIATARPCVPPGAPLVCHPVDCRLVASRPTSAASRYTVLARLPMHVDGE